MLADSATLFVSIIAQDAAPAAPGGAPANPNLQPVSSGTQAIIMFAPLVLLFIVMIWLSSSSARKREKERLAMLGNLKKGDRVRMAGGELGSIVEVRENEVLLKVDESSNTKIRYVKDAVAAVVETGKPGTVVGDKSDAK
jgi:preprotein translocase subunit YajC